MIETDKLQPGRLVSPGAATPQEDAIERALLALPADAVQGAHTAVNAIMQELVNQGVADKPVLETRRGA